MHPSTVGVQVVGFGPAALGLLVAADRLGVLQDLLDCGVTFLERASTREEAQGSRFPWKIVSNSVAKDFVGFVSPSGAFAPCLQTSHARYMIERSSKQVWLPTVGDFVNDIAGRVEYLCRGSFLSGVRYGASVARVTRNTGLFTTFDSEGMPLVTSQTIIFATGAEEQNAAGAMSSIQGIASNKVLAGQTERVYRALRSERNVVVVGSAHSAFGVVDMLLRRFEGPIGTGQLVVACRSKVKTYFASCREALDNGCTPTPDMVCPETGAIHRWDGLRGRAADLYCAIQRGEEKRVALWQESHDSGPLDGLTSGDVMISATGYRSRIIELTDDCLGRLEVETNNHRARVDSLCRIIVRGGGYLPNAFGIGLGYPRSDCNGGPKVGLNCFFGPDSAVIVRQLLANLVAHRMTGTAGDSSPTWAEATRRSLE